MRGITFYMRRRTRCRITRMAIFSPPWFFMLKFYSSNLVAQIFLPKFNHSNFTAQLQPLRVCIYFFYFDAQRSSTFCLCVLKLDVSLRVHFFSEGQCHLFPLPSFLTWAHLGLPPPPTHYLSPKKLYCTHRDIIDAQFS